MLLSRRALLEGAAGAAVAGGSLTALVQAAGVAGDDEFNADLVPAPDDPARWQAFHEALHRWRDETRRRLAYDDSLYRRPEFAWTPTCFASCLLMLCDESFLHAQTGRYRVEEFLDNAREEFGGFDAVILWQAYPRIGLDDRNQFDFYRDLPGGLTGLRDAVRRFHARGVRAFVAYNPWDKGTRRESVADLDALAELVGAIDADGVFLDTLHQGAAEFRQKLDAQRPGVVLESELALPLERIADHHMSWAQWFLDSPAPGVLRNKWFERRHMQHQIHRWNHDHTAELHMAWMNGSGMVIWENVFGSWVGWSARDKSILRSMLPIQRRFWRVFAGERWMPLAPTEQAGVFASLWEGDGRLRLWTLVNRTEQPVDGAWLRVARGGQRFYDLIRGNEAATRAEGDNVVLACRIAPRGIGAFVAGSDAALGAGFAEFLQDQARLHARADWDSRFVPRTARLTPLDSSRREARDEVPKDMVVIPAATRKMRTVFLVRECGFYESHNDLLGGSRYPRLHYERAFEREVTLAPYAIDRTPVTNAQFAAFLAAGGYRPRLRENFLKHWNGREQPPAKLEDHPVVYVDLEDARAYARWAGKRLPTEEEWQYAAQGSDGRRYPWGDELKPGLCNGGETGGTTPVTAFPDGRSPFGCLDMCGNTWEWTESERSDGRTRFCMLKGGSHYRAAGSQWYMSGGPQPCDFAAKTLLMWPGLDRCATVGFRCAADVSAT